jgi:beta propeller repeat protein
MNPIGRKALVLLTAAAIVLAATGCAAERLSPNEFDQVAPAFNGDDVLWEDSRNDETAGTDIYRFNYSTATETKVAGGAGEQDQPGISDQYMVWIDGGRLRAQSLLPGSTPFNVTNGPATQTDPAICGSLVVWSDTGGNSNIYAKNLPSGPVVPVATSSTVVEAYPACDEGRVVYTWAPPTVSSDIRLYSMSSGQTSVVADQFWNEWRPSISGNRVVWQAWPNGPGSPEGIQIYGKNLSTNQNFVVSEGPNNQTAPVISGSTVAWEDFRRPDGRPLIWWRDIATTMPQGGIPVDSALAGEQLAPSLVGRNVAFQSDAHGPWNAYLAQLFFFTPPAG